MTEIRSYHKFIMKYKTEHSTTGYKSITDRPVATEQQARDLITQWNNSKINKTWKYTLLSITTIRKDK